VAYPVSPAPVPSPGAAPAIRRKPTRTLSGVAVVAVMTAPARCPHGTCRYCPGGLERRSPQSYTGEEPSAMRAAQYGYDARAITSHRLAALTEIGHVTSKVEVIVQGGTFPSRPVAYQRQVFAGIFAGLNGTSAPSLAEAHRLNESAEHRCVGLTVETRPDCCDARVLPGLIDSGVTRVELGVECLEEEVLEAVGRAHGVNEVKVGTREARDRGLKVAYHMMLGLPGMDPRKDLEGFRRLWSEPAYAPDMLKIYPTLVLPGTGLFEDWSAGRYTPYDEETAGALLASVKRELPPWVRVQRIQRDIPARLIAAGVRHGNLREEALARLRAEGGRCRCLRCREVGRRSTPDPSAFRLSRRSYPAAGGREEFLSFEEPESEAVAAFLRLRFPSTETPGVRPFPVIRELKALGRELAVGAEPQGATSYQHRGFGRALVREAEELAREEGAERLSVLSAVGTRGYYRKLGFVDALPYLEKELT